MPDETAAPAAPAVPASPPAPPAPPAAAPAAPPPAAPAAQPAAPAQSALPGVPVPDPARKKKKRLRLTQEELTRQVAKAAEKLARDKLGGIALEQAKAIIDEASSRSRGEGKPDPVLEAEMKKLRDAVTKLTERNERLDGRIARTIVRERDKRVRVELEAFAVKAGIQDAHVDFALDQYRKHVMAAGDKVPTDPAAGRAYTLAFFTGLRAGQPYLFGQPAAEPTPALPTTAPPSDPAAVGAPPPAPPGGPRGQIKTVDDMNEQEFLAHRRATHGF